MRISHIIPGICFAAALAVAQPSTTNTPARPAPQSPANTEWDDSGKVLFRFRAAKAQEVTVGGQWSTNRTSLTKGTNDVWSVELGPIKPGVYEYSFYVDGLQMIDPSNPAVKPMRQPRTSILHIPGNPPLIHDFKDVPHGVVREHAYRSKTLGRLRNLSVYTPPGYDNGRGKFPTLYLQHGNGDNQATWTTHGKAHWILDNLIAEKKAVPMVVVMMDGHAVLPGVPGSNTNNTGAFERDLLEDVLPFVEANYRVKKDAANRGIVGLSMGGGQSLTIGLRNAELFGWVGGFSAGVPGESAISKALENPGQTNKKLKLLWIACGKGDFLVKRNEDFIALLEKKGIRYEWFLTEGDHSWPVWRIYLADFAPRVFQKRK
jgi:enterochelin esterase family protein